MLCGVEVHVRPLGALIQRLLLPGEGGKVEDAVLGFDRLAPYEDGTSPYFGVVVGRVANRIAASRFSVGGSEFAVEANEGANCLHGGPVGFDKRVWKVASHVEGKSVVLTHVSPDGDQGFPGEVTATVKYELSEAAEGGADGGDHGLLLVEMSAVTTKATPISLAQHSYFNLSGHASGKDVLRHRLLLNAAQYTPVDDKLIPTGQLAETEGTPFHFLAGAAIGDRIAEVEGGYDHNFVLNAGAKRGRTWGCGSRLSLAEEKVDALHLAAVLEEEGNGAGRRMELSTSASGVQFYSGNFLDGSIAAAQGTKDGATYHKHGGLCLETQGFPNAVNCSAFPTNVLNPGETYSHLMVYKFS